MTEDKNRWQSLVDHAHKMYDKPEMEASCLVAILGSFPAPADAEQDFPGLAVHDLLMSLLSNHSSRMATPLPPLPPLKPLPPLPEITGSEASMKD